MTSKAQRNAGFLLPEQLTGHDLIPVCLCIPDEPHYRAAFLGALEKLAKPWNWQALNESEYPRQHEAAQYWRQLLFEYLKMPCDPCLSIAECLSSMEPGSELYNALESWLSGQITSNPDIIQEIQNGGGGSVTSPIASELEYTSCDEDALFGFTLQLVQFINRVIIDAFEKLELATNWIEFGQLIAVEIPLLTELTDFVEYMFDTLVEAYQANYTQELEYEYACQLFCIAMQPGKDCTLSWFDAYSYFMTRFGYEFEDATLDQLVEFVVGGNWDGSEFCDISFAVFCNVMHHMGEWFGCSLKFIQSVWDSLTNDPNPDWETLCTGCIWEYTIDFTTEGVGGWEISSDFIAENQGVFVSGQGWKTTWRNNGPNPGHSGGNDSSRALCISHPLSTGSRITYAKLIYDYANSGHWDGLGNTHHVLLVDSQSVATEIIQKSASSDNTNLDKELSYSDSVESPVGLVKVRFISGRWWQDSDPGGEVVLKSITFRGRGDNPFE